MTQQQAGYENSKHRAQLAFERTLQNTGEPTSTKIWGAISTVNTKFCPRPAIFGGPCRSPEASRGLNRARNVKKTRSSSYSPQRCASSSMFGRAAVVWLPRSSRAGPLGGAHARGEGGGRSLARTSSFRKQRRALLSPAGRRRETTTTREQPRDPRAPIFSMRGPRGSPEVPTTSLGPVFRPESIFDCPRAR